MHIYPDAATVARAFAPDQPVILNRPHAAARAARFFTEKFPGKSLYAVKANPSPDLLQILWDSGVTHFDVASIAEVPIFVGDEWWGAIGFDDCERQRRWTSELDALRAAGREDDTLVVYLSAHGMPLPGAKATVYDSGLHSPLIVSSLGDTQPAPPSTAQHPSLVRPDAAEHRPPPAAESEPNPPQRSPIQSVWVASFSTVAMASFSSVVDRICCR